MWCKMVLNIISLTSADTLLYFSQISFSLIIIIFRNDSELHKTGILGSYGPLNILALVESLFASHTRIFNSLRRKFALLTRKLTSLTSISSSTSSQPPHLQHKMFPPPHCAYKCLFPPQSNNMFPPTPNSQFKCFSFLLSKTVCPLICRNICSSLLCK